MSVKSLLKAVLPPFVLDIYRERRDRKQREIAALNLKGGLLNQELLRKSEYPSDLLDSEKYALLAILKRLEQTDGGRFEYLEIGIFGGGTMQFLKKHTSRVSFTGVDLFEEFQGSADNTHVSGTFTQEAVQQYLGSEVTLIKGDSMKVLPSLQKKYHLIFIDGNHSYQATLEDFRNSLHLLAPGGYVGFHNCSAHLWPDRDYIQSDGGPWAVTQEVRKMAQFQLEIDIDRIRIFSQRKN